MANEKAVRAFELYKSGMKLVAVAEELGVPPGTVRRWKSTQRWDEKAPNVKANVRAANERKKANARTVGEMVAASDENPDLTEQQKRFCLLYAQRPNATRAYRLAYEGCAYNTARTEGPRLLAKPAIRRELAEQKQIIMEQMMPDPADLFRKHWDIAFADMGEFVRWGSEDVDTGVVDDRGEPITRKTNYVCFVDSSEVDTTLISEVKQGRDGVSVKLADQQKSLAFLERYFTSNPMDQHRMEYDRLRHELDERRLAIEEAKAGNEGAGMGDVHFNILPAESMGEMEDEDGPEDE